ncbi:succinylglutamate desuccinylase [Halorubrum sp. Atlit-8R]|uniref:succinylglutamate desuccinylase/aspartoacylase family protein n=1 Tax=unclassified Halorubrum TaxID=2642239 RepID=UPI000EF1E052|nr:MULTISPECIES: succinylglutamate desuccinylase/aspartoacylase family protein [unclassified Halorubrum]RLM68061.1 succinylglutamate desuccinylase [Halorubrum sp. Atlit-9R]RLM81231.1 succinylglutamate desuccinylase [Halorubrum sp. Atlit-8R]
MHTSRTLTLARLPSGVPIRTTVHAYGEGRLVDGDDGPEVDAPGDGPVVYAQAAQHGREVNGTAVLRRLHDRLTGGAEGEAGTGGAERADGPTAADLDGTLVTVPVADPLTFDRVSYTTPESLDSRQPNMNRCWPGDPEGSLHERMAARLWAFASEADAIVDLHTGSPSMATHTVYMRGDDDCRGLAEAFGTDLLLAEAAGDDADTEWDERGFAGKLRVAATREGIPTITPELAHSKEIVPAAVETGVAGTLGVLRREGLLDGEPDPWDGVVARNHLGRVIADDSGLFVPEPDLAVGDRVAAGERVGEVFDPTAFETLQVARADRDGIAYSVAREATVTAGATLVGVAERIDGE